MRSGQRPQCLSVGEASHATSCEGLPKTVLQGNEPPPGGLYRLSDSRNLVTTAYGSSDHKGQCTVEPIQLLLALNGQTWPCTGKH